VNGTENVRRQAQKKAYNKRSKNATATRTRTRGVLAGFCVTFVALILGGKIADSRIEPTVVTYGQVAVLLFGLSTSLFICASEFFMLANDFDVFSIPE
jgi:hypothetical protein